METNDDVISQTVKELHGMVQESKRLLMKWQRTSKLSKEEVLDLRRQTKAYQMRSSSAIVTKFINESGLYV